MSVFITTVQQKHQMPVCLQQQPLLKFLVCHAAALLCQHQMVPTYERKTLCWYWGEYSHTLYIKTL